MSSSDHAGLGKLVPGFDFLQSLAKNAGNSIPQMPNLSNWVAPTLNVEELDKRIDELKNVHFWLEQNSRALGATIQALEVQKMTLNTLKGMNFNIGDVANALKLKAADSVYSGVQRVSERAASTAKSFADATAGAGTSKGSKSSGGIAGLVDPLHLWSALTQQFQQIAASAAREASSKTAVDLTRNVASGVAKGAMESGKAAVGAAKRRVGKSDTTPKTTRSKPASGKK